MIQATLTREISQMDKLMRFVNLKCPRLSPYKAQMRLNTPEKKDTFEYCVKKLGDRVDSNRTKCQTNDLQEILINDVEAVKESRLGDCGESSSLMMTSLLENGYKDGEIARLLISAEVKDMKTKEVLDKQIFDTSHELVVRKMADNADAENIKTYGKDLMIIDAWAGFCANLQEGFKKYYDIFLSGIRSLEQPEQNVVIEYKPLLQKIVSKENFAQVNADTLKTTFPELMMTK